MPPSHSSFHLSFTLTMVDCWRMLAIAATAVNCCQLLVRNAIPTTDQPDQTEREFVQRDPNSPNDSMPHNLWYDLFSCCLPALLTKPRDRLRLSLNLCTSWLHLRPTILKRRQDSSYSRNRMERLRVELSCQWQWASGRLSSYDLISTTAASHEHQSPRPLHRPSSALYKAQANDMLDGQ